MQFSTFDLGAVWGIAKGVGSFRAVRSDSLSGKDLARAVKNANPASQGIDVDKYLRALPELYYKAIEWESKNSHDSSSVCDYRVAISYVDRCGVSRDIFANCNELLARNKIGKISVLCIRQNNIQDYFDFSQIGGKQDVVTALSEAADRRCHFWSLIRQCAFISWAGTIGCVILSANAKFKNSLPRWLIKSRSALFYYFVTNLVVWQVAKKHHRWNAQVAGVYDAVAVAWGAHKNIPSDKWARMIAGHLRPQESPIPSTRDSSQKRSGSGAGSFNNPPPINPYYSAVDPSAPPFGDLESGAEQGGEFYAGNYPALHSMGKGRGSDRT
jgi:hypothetical protein